MSIETMLIIGMGIFLVITFLVTLFLFVLDLNYRRKHANSTGKVMTPRASFRLGLSLTLFFLYMIITAGYMTWIGKFHWLLGGGWIIGTLYFTRGPLKLMLDNYPIHPDVSVPLPLKPLTSDFVTPELVLSILEEECVIAAIKKDLQKVKQIGGNEQWRLGLLTPDMDLFDQSYRIPVSRAAIIHPIASFNIQLKRLMIMHGATRPLLQNYPGWTYGFRSPIQSKEYRNIRDIEIDTRSPSATNRSGRIADFLREDGFPLKRIYQDGDPLTTERHGTVVIDRGIIKLIHSNYFIQSRLIDDEGNLIYMGLDENFHPSSTWSGITLIPSVSMRLFKTVRYEGLTPILRYRSLPYISNFMFPILDTPMSESGWADMFIDPNGRAKLFIAKQKSLEEWQEMMNRLRMLFFSELKKKGNHLLGLTKDQSLLNDYLYKKQMILAEYFIVLDWFLE